MKYVFEGEVTGVGEEFKSEHLHGTGSAAEFKKVSVGWHLSLRVAGHYIGLLFPEKPELAPGDKIKITLEKTRG